MDIKEVELSVEEVVNYINNNEFVSITGAGLFISADRAFLEGEVIHLYKNFSGSEELIGRILISEKRKFLAQTQVKTIFIV